MATKISNASSGLSPEDLRTFMLDNQVENNLLDLDLTWSEQEIADAMRRCAMMWNGTPPLSGSLGVDPLRLPNRYAFLIGTAYQMYLSKLQQYMRNDMDYEVGGVKANLFAKRIGHFQKLLGMLREEFSMLARTEKTNRNVNNAWGLLC